MNKFVKGMLLGIGIGLLIAPMRGEEMRKKVGRASSSNAEAIYQNRSSWTYTNSRSPSVSLRPQTL